MDVEAMAVRCPGATLVGIATLEGHAFRVNRNHHATILPAAGKRVYGVLWLISEADQSALDDYEGVAIALYRRHEVLVERPEGHAIPALTYMARNTDATRTSGPYFEDLLRAARTHGLPAGYLAELEAWRLDDGWSARAPGAGRA